MPNPKAIAYTLSFVIVIVFVIEHRKNRSRLRITITNLAMCPFVSVPNQVYTAWRDFYMINVSWEDKPEWLK